MTTADEHIDTRQFQIDNMEHMGTDYFRFDEYDARYSIATLTIVTCIWWVYGFWFGVLSLGTYLLSMRRGKREGRAWFRFGLWIGNTWIKTHGGIIWQASRLRPIAPFGGITVRGIKRIGLLHRSGSDTFMVEGDGMAFAGRNIARQYGILHGLAEIVRRLASSEPRFRIGVSPIFARLPPDRHSFAGYLGSGVYGKILRPDPEVAQKSEDDLTRDEKRRLNLRRLATGQIEIVRQASFRPRMLLAITVKHRGALAAAFKTRSLAERQVDRLPVMKMVTSAEKHLKRLGVVNPRVLSSDDLKEYIRSIDVVHYDKHYAIRAQDRADGVDTYDKATPPIMIEGRNERLWRAQQRIWTDGRIMVIDGTFYAAIELTTMPRLSHPSQLAELDALDPEKAPYFIRCYLSQTMRSTREEQTLSIGSATIDEAHKWFGSNQTKGRAAKNARERDRRLELAVDSGFTQQSIPVYILLAPSLDKLEDAIAEATSHAEYLNMGPQLVTGETSLKRIIVAGVTGIPV